jgi:hypothetical protein
VQTSFPERTRNLANRYLNLIHEQFVPQPLLNPTLKYGVADAEKKYAGWDKLMQQLFVRRK